jgi:O-antigen/teichoic acid export membrane protein
MGGDIARFGFAILLATVFGAVQVFVIPRKLDIATYGEYRIFLLWVGYIGILHFGLADGAFLRWAGRPMGGIRHEAALVTRWLLAIGIGLLVIALAISAVVPEPLSRVYFIGMAVAALAMNIATLIGYALQAAGDFRGAGRVAALSPGIFVAAIVFLPLHSLTTVLVAYVVSFAIAAAVGAVRIAGTSASDADVHPEALDFRTMVRTGLPVLGANTAAALSQFGDRILVSVAVPITSFALYGFASSVMVTANAATQALSRVALSHAARLPGEGDGRAVLLGGFYDLIAAGFGAAMAGVPFFEYLVSRTLPVYAPAIPIVRALVIGSPFWVGIHVVLVGTLQSYGLVRKQLALELLGLVLVALICGGLLLGHTELWVVASGSTAAAVVAWAIGIAYVRHFLPGTSAQPTVRFATISVIQAVAVILALSLHQSWLIQSAVYVALGGIPTIYAARAAKRHGW